MERHGESNYSRLLCNVSGWILQRVDELQTQLGAPLDYPDTSAITTLVTLLGGFLREKSFSTRKFKMFIFIRHREMVYNFIEIWCTIFWWIKWKFLNGKKKSWIIPDWKLPWLGVVSIPIKLLEVTFAHVIKLMHAIWLLRRSEEHFPFKCCKLWEVTSPEIVPFQR